MVAVTKQEMWMETWASLMVDAQFQKITNTEMKLYMEALLRNRLLLVSPPARIWHPLAQQADFREHIIDQLITRKNMATLPVSETLLWNRNNCVLIRGGWDLKAAKIHATAQLKLEAGALDYDLLCDPFTNWEFDLPRQTREGYASNSSEESTGQNYYPSHSIMKPLNILAWNVRGAASSEFRRAFMDLIGRHKPNVVLLTETRVGGDRAQSIINSVSLIIAELTRWAMPEGCGCSGTGMRSICALMDRHSKRFMPLLR